MVADQATSAALRSAVPGPAVVHLACHGQYRQANPMFSALRFADRWMTASELLELDFGGALVTLSACETGKHGSDSAEPIGLAWAFLAAGARGAVVSQWLVDDTVTAQLMSVLYRELAAGSAPATALRTAQLEVSEVWEHPYYWAPFSYVASTRYPDRSPG
jgi:CHAT domain-containing protein